MTFEEQASAIVYAPGVASGFVQQCFALEESKGRDGSPIYTRRHTFRVVVLADGGKKHADMTRGTLHEAAAAAFAKLGVALPNLEPEPFEA